MVYADFEIILVPENNKRQIPDESYTNKYQKHVVCSYGYKLVCVHDKFSKLFKSYLLKMMFTDLRIAYGKKVNIVVMCRKTILRKNF